MERSLGGGKVCGAEVVAAAPLHDEAGRHAVVGARQRTALRPGQHAVGPQQNMKSLSGLFTVPRDEGERESVREKGESEGGRGVVNRDKHCAAKLTARPPAARATARRCRARGNAPSDIITCMRQSPVRGAWAGWVGSASAQVTQ